MQRIIYPIIFVLLFWGQIFADAPKPNILLILTDDIGWGDFSCNNPDGKIITPEIDRLAATGMKFTHAHSPAALCAPTRYAILTGNYPWRGRDPEGTWGWYGGSGLLPGQKTFGNLLQSAGYRTAMFGKANIGLGYEKMLAPDKPDLTSPLSDGPVQWGFDYSYIIPRGHQHCLYAYYENNKIIGDPNDIVELQTGPYNGDGEIGGRGPGMKDWDSVDVGRRLTEKAMTFIDNHLAQNKTEGKDRPFLIHFCTDGCHSPHTPPATLFGKPLKGATGMIAKTDMVYEVDIILGQFVRVLKERGLYNNTLIIITSDNGGTIGRKEVQDFGHDPVGGLKGQKGTIWEGGTRVPFVVHWGDDTKEGSKITPGSISHQEIALHDVVPTFCELAGVNPGQDQALDSVSILPVLLGKQEESKPIRESLLIQAGQGQDAHVNKRTEEEKKLTPQAYVNYRIRKAQKIGLDGIGHAVYINGWKLMFSLNDDQAEYLADLNNDPFEKENVIADPKSQSQRNVLEKEYRRIRSSARSTPPLQSP